VVAVVVLEGANAAAAVVVHAAAVVGFPAGAME
jgi:hypothetical protein